jgi:hypothetical protein
VQEADDGYAPNSSQKRRALRTNSVKALRNCPEGIELVRSLRSNCQEIGGLGYALIFETLTTTLLILLALVRLGAAGAKHVGKWLDEEALLKGSNGEHKREGLTDEESLTDKTENLTDDRKHLMADSGDLSYTTFPYLSVNVSPATFSTVEDIAVTPSSSSDGQENP